MTQHERAGFFSSRTALNMDDYLVLDYYFECTTDPEVAAAHLCREQSTAQWKRVGVNEDLRVEYGSKVLEIEVERTTDTPSLPFFVQTWDPPLYGVRAKIAYPIGNFGPRIPNLLTAVAGEGVFHCPGIYLIKLFDIEFPAGYLQQFDGPKFGIEGLREWTEVYDRPLFFGVIKPNVGLPPDAFAELALESWLGGLDIAKDDEMLCDTEWSPFSERTRVLGRARSEAEQRTGKRCCYLANITDEVERLIELHDIGVKHGADMLMINAMCTGLSAARMLRKHTEVPLVAHFDLIAPFTRTPFFGIHSTVITKLQRLCGFDAIIGMGLDSRMNTPPKEVLASVRTCTDEMGAIKQALPIPAGSQWAGSLEPLYRMIGHVDFGIVPGRAVFNHPGGPRAGAVSLHQGWEAFQEKVSLAEYGRNHAELAQSVREFVG